MKLSGTVRPRLDLQAIEEVPQRGQGLHLDARAGVRGGTPPNTGLS